MRVVLSFISSWVNVHVVLPLQTPYCSFCQEMKCFPLVMGNELDVVQIRRMCHVKSKNPENCKAILVVQSADNSFVTSLFMYVHMFASVFQPCLYFCFSCIVFFLYCLQNIFQQFICYLLVEPIMLFWHAFFFSSLPELLWAHGMPRWKLSTVNAMSRWVKTIIHDSDWDETICISFVYLSSYICQGVVGMGLTTSVPKIIAYTQWADLRHNPHASGRLVTVGIHSCRGQF